MLISVLLQENAKEQYTCDKMSPLIKVTLKGGLQAGDFTDVGKVTNLEQCYDTCCQQSHCDLAFMLGQNCFSVQCKDKKLCGVTKAQPSIFNPQIAYVLKRTKVIPITNNATTLTAKSGEISLTYVSYQCGTGHINGKSSLCTKSISEPHWNLNVLSNSAFQFINFDFRYHHNNVFSPRINILDLSKSQAQVYS